MKNKENMLFYTSIAMMVIGGLWLLTALLVIVAGNAADSILGSTIFGKISVLLSLVRIIISALYIFAGYYGYKHKEDAENATVVLTLGIVCTALSLINLLGSFTFKYFLLMLVPAAYSYGAYQLKTGETIDDTLLKFNLKIINKKDKSDK